MLMWLPIRLRVRMCVRLSVRCYCMGLPMSMSVPVRCYCMGLPMHMSTRLRVVRMLVFRLAVVVRNIFVTPDLPLRGDRHVDDPKF